MPYEMKQTEIAECLGISRSAVSQWRLPDTTIPTVMAAARARDHSLEPLWLHVLAKLNDFADSMAGSTQITELANQLLENANTPIPDYLHREVIVAANGLARLARQVKELREDSVDWIDRRTLEDCLIRVNNQANLALGEEFITTLTRAGVSKRRAAEIAEAWDIRVSSWFEEIIRTANYEPTYSDPQGWNVFDPQAVGGESAPAPVAEQGRKKA